jgi:feruloyl-CoA synthase
VDIASWDVAVTQETCGALRVRPYLELGPYPKKLTESLDYWAEHAPDRTFLAKRDQRGVWQHLNFSQFRSVARNVAQALLNLGMTPEHPIAILSGNDLEHAILGMAAMYAGIPYAPISPAYSLVSRDLGKLRHIFDLLEPGLVYAADGLEFSRAIESVVPLETHLVVAQNPPRNRHAELFETLNAAEAGEAVDRANGTVTADTVAKILFTSGSTDIPKGVINTQRMLCSNQEMLRTVFPVFGRTPPVICDWLPWNHTFGGNHNFGLVLYNGGSLFIDDGKPLAGAFDETIRNLREIAPTVYFNVPKGYEELVEHMKRDADLRRNFFSRLEMTFYAAAGLSQRVWDALDELAIETCGERILMLTGLGATETGPFALCANKETTHAGVVGLPVPGVELKLVPVGQKLEARVRGPNVTPGFWRQAELTHAAFDEDGFYCLGDALRFLDPQDPAKGFVFDGRIAEDFKLSTGTWVSVGPLRASFLRHAEPYVKDIVIAGHDRDQVTALIFPDPDEYQRLEHNGGALMEFGRLLRSFGAQSTGSSNRIERAIVLKDLPSIDAGEITDKGSINQRAVLQRRADLVEHLYRVPRPEFVLSIDEKEG